MESLLPSNIVQVTHGIHHCRPGRSISSPYTIENAHTQDINIYDDNISVAITKINDTDTHNSEAGTCTG